MTRNSNQPTAIRTIEPVRARLTGQHTRTLICGWGGTGKTLSSLLIARELVGPDGKILLVDTDKKGPARWYGDQVEFDHFHWEPPFDPRELGPALAPVAGNYDLTIVDNTTPFWGGEGGTRDIVDEWTRRNPNGHKLSGWGEAGNPAQSAFVDALLDLPCHLIACCRATEANSVGEGGKVIKLGERPDQRGGWEFAYEFDVVLWVDRDHTIRVEKARPSTLTTDQKFPKSKTAEIGQALNAGAAELITDDQADTLRALLKQLGPESRSMVEKLQRRFSTPLARLTLDQFGDAVAVVEARLTEIAGNATPDGAEVDGEGGGHPVEAPVEAPDSEPWDQPAPAAA